MTISSVQRGIPICVAYWEAAGLQNNTFIRVASPGVSYKLRDKNAIGRRRWNISSQELKICDMKIEIFSFVVNGSVTLTTPTNRQ